MSTNHTANYDLCQWEATDQVLRTDFNQDNAKIDAALKSQADSVSGLSGEIDGLAQSIAANTSALNGKGNCEVYTTTYTGTGLNYHSVTLPGLPMFIMVSGGYHCLWGVRNSSFGLSFNQFGQGTDLSFGWGNQSVSWSTSLNDDEFPCNMKNTTYYVLALLQR